MKKILGILIFISIFFISTANSSFAIYDPFSKPNNIFGIHILSPDEVFEAKSLVNSSDGDWGYVTIPIQVSDKNLIKWQKFMDDCRSLHLIPIIRVSTTGDYFNTKVWAKPDYSDLLDFANFLNSLSWPVKNRYVIIFNEANRGDEWGGIPNASEYADLLSYASDIFKSVNKDFFVISAGLDNASPTVTDEYIDEYTFLYRMNQAVPGIFNKIDGLASHSYPNPGFSQPPFVLTSKSIQSFKYEQNFVRSLSGRKLPIFITETGWSGDKISEGNIANYYRTAFTDIWNDDTIVAVTPFLLRAGAGSFKQFSFLDENGEKTAKYKTVQALNKIRGEPEVNIPSEVTKTSTESAVPVKNFSNQLYGVLAQRITIIKTFFRFFLDF